MATEPRNPYAAPSSTLADPLVERSSGAFFEDGISVSAGRGASWWSKGFEIFKASAGMWLVIGIIVGVLAFGVLMLFGVLMKSSAASPVLVLVFGVVMQLAWPGFLAGLLLGARAVDEGEGLRIGHLFAGFAAAPGKLLLFGLAMLVINGIIQALAMGLIGGSFVADMKLGRFDWQLIMLVVLVYFAILIPIAMAGWFAAALIAFHDLGIWRAIRSSFLGSLKNVAPFLVYGLVFMGLAFVFGIIFAIASAISPIFGALLFLAVMFIGIPVFIGTLYASYVDIYLEA